jgi:hypothetical protein
MDKENFPFVLEFSLSGDLDGKAMPPALTLRGEQIHMDEDEINRGHRYISSRPETEFVRNGDSGTEVVLLRPNGKVKLKSIRHGEEVYTPEQFIVEFGGGAALINPCWAHE